MRTSTDAFANVTCTCIDTRAPVRFLHVVSTSLLSRGLEELTLARLSSKTSSDSLSPAAIRAPCGTSPRALIVVLTELFCFSLSVQVAY